MRKSAIARTPTETFAIGDKIEPNDLPGLILTVLEVTQCPDYCGGCSAYVVENDIGDRYALCAYEVHRASIRGFEGLCSKCGEIFIPADFDDLEHLEREDGTECGGPGILSNAYGMIVR
jgi:hypothetical protein